VLQDRARDQGVRDRDHRGNDPVDPRQLLADHAVGQDVAEGAAVLLGDHRAHEAQGRELRDQLERVALLALVALDVGQDLLLRELADGLAHQALLRRELEVGHALEGRGEAHRSSSGLGS
jgi:hypothetical protein